MYVKRQGCDRPLSDEAPLLDWAAIGRLVRRQTCDAIAVHFATTAHDVLSRGTEPVGECEGNA
jgi:hypothetical protein